LTGVSVVRASDGKAVELRDHLLEAMSSGTKKTAVVYFMRSFG
jgi:hypothetical protein